MIDRPLFSLDHKQLREFAAQDAESLELVREELSERTSRGARKLADELRCVYAVKTKHPRPTPQPKAAKVTPEVPSGALGTSPLGMREPEPGLGAYLGKEPGTRN